MTLNKPHEQLLVIYPAYCKKCFVTYLLNSKLFLNLLWVIWRLNNQMGKVFFTSIGIFSISFHDNWKMHFSRTCRIMSRFEAWYLEHILRKLIFSIGKIIKKWTVHPVSGKHDNNCVTRQNAVYWATVAYTYLKQPMLLACLFLSA